jgi:hypothetical protein
MLFQSDYWFASNWNEKLETLQNFIGSSDDIVSLCIIGKDDVQAILDTISPDDIPCSLALITESEANFIKRPGKHSKTIYVSSGFDVNTLALMKRLYPILAIFV